MVVPYRVLWDTTRTTPVDARLERCECGGRCLAFNDGRSRECTTECGYIVSSGQGHPPAASTPKTGEKG